MGQLDKNSPFKVPPHTPTSGLYLTSGLGGMIDGEPQVTPKRGTLYSEFMALFANMTSLECMPSAMPARRKL